MSRPVPVRLGLFSTSVVIRIAQDAGHFADQGLEVTEHAVASSRAQFASLLAAEYDLVMTGPDNVLAYRFDPANPLGRTGDVRILAGLDRGLGLSLIGAPGIGGLDDLRGRAVAVDVPDSGFAFVLYRLLSDGGLAPGVDCRIIAAGATPRRRDALLAGEFAATLLNAGHDVAAVHAGCVRLGRAVDTISPFLGTVLAGDGAWIDANRDIVRRFCTAWAAAAGVVADPAERDVALAVVRTQLGLSAAAADDHYKTLISPDEGVIADGRLDMAALAQVARLRAQHGRLGGVAPEPTALLESGLVDSQCR